MATFTIASGATTGDYSASSTSIDIGTVTDQQVINNSGTLAIPLTFTGPSGTYTYNFSGSTRNFIIQGYKTGTAAQLRTFTNDLEQIDAYQNSSASDSYFTYTNTNSQTNAVYNGVRVKMESYHTRETNDVPLGVVSYTIKLVQSR